MVFPPVGGVIARRIVPVALLLLLAGGLGAAFSKRPWTPRAGVMQPIEFSHRVHAGENRIPCQYCHEYARRSRSAGVPSMQRCVGCHRQVAGSDAAPEAAARPWIEPGPLPFAVAWNRVYALPDFVRFSHRPHVRAKIACQQCHGPVETMERVEPVAEINMGFCLSCHTERKASTDCSICHY
jgi:cytochrome c7-like protein